MSQNRKPIYVDMDNVLIAPVLNLHDEPIDLLIRPGVDSFLGRLSVYGDLNLLTAASQEWAKIVLGRLGPITKLFKNVITGEDLYPIDQQIEVINRAEVPPEEKENLFQVVEPIYPPGVIFDDFPRGSRMYLLKGLATGIVRRNPHLWIQVEEFAVDVPDQNGLEKAYQEFLKRNASWKSNPSIGKRAMPAFEGSIR